MTALVLLAHFAQTPAAPYAAIIEDRRRLAAFSAAHQALGADHPLLDHHRGLAAFLEAEAALGLAETAYREELRRPTFRAVTSAFGPVVPEPRSPSERDETVL